MARTKRVTTTAQEPVELASFPLNEPSLVHMPAEEYKRTVDIIINGADQAGLRALAWHFLDRIGELHFVTRYVANAVSMASLYVAEVKNDPYNPERLSEDHPANQLLSQWAGGPVGQADLLDRIALHLTITGDSVLAGPWDARSNPMEPFTQWRAYSPDEVTARNGVAFYRGPDGREKEISDTVLAFRVWRPHPRRYWRADSPTLGALRILREIDLFDQHVEASAVSRLTGAGLILIPDEITFPASEVETEGEEVDPFIRRWIEVASIAIKNRDSAAAMVPIALRGPMEALKEIRHLTFDTPFSEMIPELRLNALRRFGLAADIPPEVLLGTAEASSWSAWQVDESTVRMHIQPILQLICNSITTGWLLPALKKDRNLSRRTDIDNLCVWFDTSRLKVRQNVVEEASALTDRMFIGPDSSLKAAGMSPGDAPSPDELDHMILLHMIRTQPELVPYAIDQLRLRGKITLAKVPEPPVVDNRVGEQGNPVNPNDKTLPGDRSSDKILDEGDPPPVDSDPNDNTPA